MEKIDAIKIEDEEGTHYVLVQSIVSVAKEIGNYNYSKRQYNKCYDKPRYILRTCSDEYFFITPLAYKKILETRFNVVLSDKREPEEDYY